eukprot:6203330-Pleurochrysis_carterae.AAC.2
MIAQAAVACTLMAPARSHREPHARGRELQQQPVLHFDRRDVERARKVPRAQILREQVREQRQNGRDDWPTSRKRVLLCSAAGLPPHRH